jgi:hypothetical protein
MVVNPVQQAIQGGRTRRLSLGFQMRMRERKRTRVMKSHLQDGRSKTDVAWLLLTPQGYINFVLVGVNVKLQLSLTFNS